MAVFSFFLFSQKEFLVHGSKGRKIGNRIALTLIVSKNFIAITRLYIYTWSRPVILRGEKLEKVRAFIRE